MEGSSSMNKWKQLHVHIRKSEKNKKKGTEALLVGIGSRLLKATPEENC